MPEKLVLTDEDFYLNHSKSPDLVHDGDVEIRTSNEEIFFNSISINGSLKSVNTEALSSTGNNKPPIWVSCAGLFLVDGDVESISIHCTEGNVDIRGDVNCHDIYTSSGDLHVAGSLSAGRISVCGGADIGSITDSRLCSVVMRDLMVRGDANFKSSLWVYGKIDILGTLKVRGRIWSEKTMTVKNDVICRSSVRASGTTSVGGDVDIKLQFSLSPLKNAPEDSALLACNRMVRGSVMGGTLIERLNQPKRIETTKRAKAGRRPLGKQQSQKLQERRGP